MQIRETGWERLSYHVAERVECSVILGWCSVVKSGKSLLVGTLRDAHHSVLPRVILEVITYVARTGVIVYAGLP